MPGSAAAHPFGSRTSISVANDLALAEALTKMENQPTNAES